MRTAAGRPAAAAAGGREGERGDGGEGLRARWAPRGPGVDTPRTLETAKRGDAARSGM